MAKQSGVGPFVYSDDGRKIIGVVNPDGTTSLFSKTVGNKAQVSRYRQMNFISSQQRRVNETASSPSGLGAANTWIRLMSVPKSFSAVRIGIQSMDTVTAQAGVKCAIAATDSVNLAGQTFGNFVPIRQGVRDDAQWKPVQLAGITAFTWPATPLDGPTTWLDWTPCSSVPRFDVPGGYPLLIVAFEFPITAVANSGYQVNNLTYNPQVEAQIPGVIERSWANVGTFVTTPAGLPSSTGPSGLGLGFIVEFRHSEDCTTLFAFGDSVINAYGIGGDFGRVGWVNKACLSIGVNCVNRGTSGYTAIQYKNQFNNLVTTTFKPSTILWQVHTVNSSNPPTRASIDEAKGIAADVMNTCNNLGIDLILVASFPGSTTAISAPNQAFVNELFAFCDNMAKVQGVYHLDVRQLHLTPGQWDPNYSQGDGLHQNIAGEDVVLAPALKTLLNQII